MNMDKVTMLVFAIVLALLVTWIIEATRVYPMYRDEIYGSLFGNFLSYFFKYAVFKDCSKSGYLKTKIGTHRMIFSAMQENGKTTNRFCTIFYNRGIMVICYQKIDGELIGKAKDKDWIVKRKDKEGTMHSYRHQNPTEDFKAYLRRIVTAYPDVHVEARIAVDDTAVYDSLKSEIVIVHNKDIVNELIMVQAPLVSDEQIVSDYQKLSAKKG
jgi:hypothetical protein